MYFQNMTVKRNPPTRYLKETCIFTDYKVLAKNGVLLNLGQISSIFFLKQYWDLAKNCEQFCSFSAPHFYNLWNALKNGGKLKYIDNKIIGYRCENSYFVMNDAYKRFYILVYETHKIAEAVFGNNSWEVKKIDSAIIKYHIFDAIIFFAKLSRPNPFIFSLKAFKLMISLYYDNICFYIYSYKILPALLCPAFILKTIRFLHRKFKKIFS
jgi:hypothetical protein